MREDTAITENEDLSEVVFVKLEDQAFVKYVETGIQDDKNIEIISGISLDDDNLITSSASE